MPHELISILVLGLVGSVHCVGMCGGFALALAQVSGDRRDFLIRQVFYYFGKTVTYMLLGVIAGAFGGIINTLFSNIQGALSIALGVVMIGVGLGLLGWMGGLKYSGRLALWKPLTSTMGRLMGQRSADASFALGLLNGLLPCGLVYGALAIAAVSGNALLGALYMGVFGLTTIPALFALASAGALMKPLWRSRLNQVSGVIVILLGLVTIFRGMPGDGMHGDHGMEEPVQQVESAPDAPATHPSHNP